MNHSQSPWAAGNYYLENYYLGDYYLGDYYLGDYYVRDYDDDDDGLRCEFM